MRLYKVFDVENPNWPVKWHHRQVDAKGELARVENDDRVYIQVDLVEVKNDVGNFLRALRGEEPQGTTVLESWRGTSRGALKPFISP